ncbi:hypothetical protein TrLO_g15942 [Triparma laevis f. longispina]|uniref:Uncharacterized protein n=1 Tax=Triparma laevis f. longispina TaxID=1714387 RepID=A0A9W6ZPF3_9STRA|nr:hypothetical protein TrLO_g15942 [Triparma laevis f. longispina]
MPDALELASRKSSDSVRLILVDDDEEPHSCCYYKWSRRRKCCCCCLLLIFLPVIAFGLAFIFIAYIPIENPIPVPEWAHGPYKTTETLVEVGGMYKQSGDQDAWAFYPDHNGTFPALAFSHGDGGGGFLLHWAFSGILRIVASHGFVVLAHKSCFWPWDCGTLSHDGGPNYQWRDQARTLVWAASPPSLDDSPENRVLSRINRELPMGVFGQSTGGRTSIQAAAAASEGPSGSNYAYINGSCIAAAVAIHPDPCIGPHSNWRHGSCDRASAITKTPLAVFTSKLDTTEPAGSAQINYDAATSTNKIYASMAGVSHIKGTGPIWALYTAAWFHVYLNGQSQGDYYFNLIYGNSTKSVCGENKNEMKMDEPIEDMCYFEDFVELESYRQI